MAEEGNNNDGNALVQNRSMLKEFLASISTMRGDLSNITAPPFVLDTKSAVELPAYWAERPSVFVAPASSEDPARRALLVLRWFISALRNQQYAGHSAEEGVKKPLNAFLGELFIAKWEDDATAGTTRLVSEQVSHHPPVTACRVWNEKHGVSAEGFTRQEITFSGNVSIKQIGHATLHIAKYDETYLIPLPHVKVKGILSGTPYPEISGTYHIPSTNGYTSVIDFSGKGLFGGGNKHTFEAKVYRDGGAESDPVYTVGGNWDGQFVIHDVAKGEDIETFDVRTATPTELLTEPLDEQDPWETRVAWKDVREALQRGDMQGTSDAKSRVEQGQREMRKDEEREGKHWERLFYRAEQRDEVAESLAWKINQKVDPEETMGLWKFKLREWDAGTIRKPYHGSLRPDNTSSSRTGGAEEKTTTTTTETEKRDAEGVVNGVAVGHMNGSETHPAGARQNNDVRPPPQDQNTKAHPPLPAEVQQHDVETSQLQSGIDGMSLDEKTNIENMLRNRYSTSGRAR